MKFTTKSQENSSTLFQIYTNARQKSFKHTNCKLQFNFNPLHEDFATRLTWAIEKRLNYTHVYILDRLIPMQRSKMTIYISQHTLAKECGKTARWIRKCVADLVRWGLLATISQGVKRTCLYRVAEIFFDAKICKKIARSLPDWFACFQSYVSRQFLQEGFKGVITSVLPNLTVTLREFSAELVLSLKNLARKSKAGSQWFANVFFPQRFERSTYTVEPKKRAPKIQKGRYAFTNLQKTVIRQDKCEKIIVTVEAKYEEAYATSEARKRVPWLDGFFEACKAKAENQKKERESYG